MSHPPHASRRLRRLARAWELGAASHRVGQVAVVAFPLATWRYTHATWTFGWLVFGFLLHGLGQPAERSFRDDPSPDLRRWHRIHHAWMLSLGIYWAVGLIGVTRTTDDTVALLLFTAFALGASSAGVIFNAAFSAGFWAMDATMLGAFGLSLVLRGGPELITLGVCIWMYLGFAWLMHREARQDVLSWLKTAEHLEHLATRDSLTDLPNRTALEPALTHALATAGPLSVLYIDLDRFKIVNDALGHRCGDELLIAVAGRFAAAVAPQGQLYRMGGDELVAVLPMVGDEAVEVAERLRLSLTDPVHLQARELRVTVSVGIASAPQAGDTPSDLLRHADAALYRAKDRGRNRVEVFDGELRDRLRRRIDDELELRRAIERGELEPWYQPIVDLRTGAIVGAEALARWRHPTRGVLAAGQFIALAEETGLDRALTDLIVVRVVDDLTAWRREQVPLLRVKVNLGAEPFSRRNLATWLSTLIRDHACPPEALGVEVTETNLLRDLKLAAEHLHKLRETGLTVALDDFGTAWSSLALLRELPLDTVKLDRMFIRELTDRPRDQALVGAVVAMARQLELDVVAEGVETLEQAALAAALGCDMAQGYLYAPAVDGPKLVSMLRSRPFEERGPLVAAG